MQNVSNTFRALVTRGKKTPATVETLTRGELPTKSTVKQSPGDCEVLVKVNYSNLNYKDALVVTGSYPGLKPPMVGGIDLVGAVLDSKSDKFKVGDQVLVNGFGIGTDHFGGFAEEAMIRADWALSLPEGLTEVEAAKIGTAGYTSMLCVEALVRNGVKPGDGPVLVTGSTGGVGSIAVVILKQLGYEVVAVSGKADAEAGWLQELGAGKVVPRADFEGEPRPLNKELYAGCVDTVGGVVLANAISMIKYGGTVSACGLAGGMGLATTVAPFILRGVTLAGVDSVFAGRDVRMEAYNKYGPVLAKSNMLDTVCGASQTIDLESLPDVGKKMLKGQIRGRYVVKL